MSNNYRICMPFIGALALALAASALGQTRSEENYGSLFPANYRNPVVDRTARAVGDLLTVVISEQASSTMAASTNATKKDSNNVSAPFVGLLKIPLLKRVLGNLGSGLTNVSTGGSSSVAGAGNSSNTSQLTARIAVIVKEVLPNGNLVIEGTKWVKVNREETNITFAGIVRRDDVRADNTVLSESVAEARITNYSKGLVAERQRRGFLTRLLDWLF